MPLVKVNLSSKYLLWWLEQLIVSSFIVERLRFRIISERFSLEIIWLSIIHFYLHSYCALSVIFPAIGVREIRCEWITVSMTSKLKSLFHGFYYISIFFGIHLSVILDVSVWFRNVIKFSINVDDILRKPSYK